MISAGRNFGHTQLGRWVPQFALSAPSAFPFSFFPLVFSLYVRKSEQPNEGGGNPRRSGGGRRRSSVELFGAYFDRFSHSRRATNSAVGRDCLTADFFMAIAGAPRMTAGLPKHTHTDSHKRRITRNRTRGRVSTANYLSSQSDRDRCVRFRRTFAVDECTPHKHTHTLTQTLVHRTSRKTIDRALFLHHRCGGRVNTGSQKQVVTRPDPPMRLFFFYCPFPFPLTPTNARGGICRETFSPELAHSRRAHFLIRRLHGEMITRALLLADLRNHWRVGG